MRSENMYLMWLSRIPGMNDKRFSAVLESFGCAEAVFRADEWTLRCHLQRDPKLLQRILDEQDEGILASYAREMESKGIRFMSRFDPDFPLYLKDIPHPPTGIYILGDLPDNNLPKVGVVGSRRCSEYGLSAAHRLSRDLAEAGVVIVSGMARGIDSQAHRGALEGGGPTVAVLGCGPDVCYPAENRALRDKIIRNGCVLSEYPPGTAPMPAYFPARNRIISGLSRAVVVVEAARRSGTNITVEQALEQGRDVYAVPGNITSRLSEGTNDFIKQGATLVSDYEDVLNNLGITYDKENRTREKTKREALAALPPELKAVYGVIRNEPVSLDHIVSKSGMAVQAVSAALVLLEMESLVEKLPGQRYIQK